MNDIGEEDEYNENGLNLHSDEASSVCVKPFNGGNDERITLETSSRGFLRWKFNPDQPV